MIKNKPLISFVIPCLNEAGTIENLLDQLIIQADETIEIIAVDNRSDDTTLAVLKSYQPKGVTVVSNIARGVSRARNAGAKKATGEWIIFFDADTIISGSFIQEITEQLSASSQFSLAALAYKAYSHNFFFRFLTYIAQSYQRLSFKIIGKPLIPGSAVAVKRTVHEKIGGFDENIRYNEDFEYSIRAYQTAHNFKALRTPSLYFSVRRLENGGWYKVIATYVKAEIMRMHGRKYDPSSYDMSDHQMK